MNESLRAFPSQLRVLLAVVLIVAAAAVGLWLAYRLASVILVLIASALFAYLVAPLVQGAERPIRIGPRRVRLPRPAAIAVVYLVLAGSTATGAVALLPIAAEQVTEMVSAAPASTQSFMAWEHGWSRYYERMRIPIPLRHRIDEFALAAGAASGDAIQRVLLSLARGLSGVPWLMLVPILAFFLLKDASDIRRTIVTALPHRLRLRGHRLFEDLNATLAAYIRAQLLACLLVGTSCGVGFAAIGIPYPVPLGILAGMLEFIPLVGPLLVAVVVTIAAALHSPILGLWAVGFLGVLRIVQDYVVYPRLIRRGLPLHPLAVIVAVLAGAELGGIAGVFLAVPAVAVVSVAIRHALAWRVEGVLSSTAQSA
ncbi:MAG TPA: AI-2E family transporter [Vicinamibacterales bacterium]